jgi:hypothetical protein
MQEIGHQMRLVGYKSISLIEEIFLSKTYSDLKEALDARIY